jgi:drug/metabolite transporter (DMT)-like permease
MGEYPLFRDLLLRTGISLLVFCTGEKGFWIGGNVSLSGTPCDADWSLLSLGEEIHWITLMGGGMILMGVYLASKKIARLKVGTP